MFEAQIRRLIHRSPYQWYQSAQRKYLNKKRIQTFETEHPCVFVLSTGRVGSKTLASIFELAPNVFAYHEPTPKLFGLSALAYKYSAEASLTRELLLETLLDMRATLFNYSLACGKGYVETGPHVTFLAPLILEAVPNAKFVHVVRKPADFVRSAMRRKWYTEHPRDKTRIFPHQETEYGKLWESFTAFQKNAWLWAETNRWITEFCATLPNDRTLLIKAEDVFASRKQTIQDIFNFVSVPPPSNQDLTQILDKKLNKQKFGTFLKPADWTGTMQKELLRIAGKIVRDLGYEHN